MRLIDTIQIVVHAYAKAKNLSVARVATIVFNDGKTITRLAQGGDVTTRRFEDAMQWFSDHWPEDADWPADVPRPVPSRTSEAAA